MSLTQRNNWIRPPLDRDERLVQNLVQYIKMDIEGQNRGGVKKTITEHLVFLNILLNFNYSIRELKYFKRNITVAVNDKLGLTNEFVGMCRNPIFKRNINRTSTNTRLRKTGYN